MVTDEYVGDVGANSIPIAVEDLTQTRSTVAVATMVDLAAPLAAVVGVVVAFSGAVNVELEVGAFNQDDRGYFQWVRFSPSYFHHYHCHYDEHGHRNVHVASQDNEVRPFPPLWLLP